MPRASWKGYLRLSLVSVPVQGYSSSKPASSIQLNQLHKPCHSRISYQKTCPIHGPVPKEEIVSGYEYADGQYVEFEPDEIASLRQQSERSITVDAVLPPSLIDPIYYTEKTWYLMPDGAPGLKPYVLLQQSLAEDNLQAVARVVLYGREEVVLVRPMERLLAMTALKFADQVSSPVALSTDLATPELGREEQTLTRTLLKSFVKKKFSLDQYKDTYVEQLRQLIEAKVEGREIVTAPAAEEPQVINLMDALKQSLAKASKTRSGPAPIKRKEATARRAKAAPRKRKSG
jgi:DNA end-binding protein Ku